MNKLKDSILKLTTLTNDVDIENALQNILELILRNYHLEFGKAKVFFTDIEMYYRNKDVYDDVTVHGDTKQTHFNEVYVHKHRKHNCFDICISLGDYHLSFLVRGAIVNGIPYYMPSQVYRAINEAKSDDYNFDEAKDILQPNSNSEINVDSYVMFSSRYNLTNIDWKFKPLRAVIDTTLIGKKIPKKEELLRSIIKGMNNVDASTISKAVIGYIIKV